MDLTFYLFDKKTNSFEQCLDSEKLVGRGRYKELPFIKKPPFDAKAFLQKNRKSTPRWANYVSEYIDTDGLVNTSNSIAILIKVSERFFGITKGYGYSILNRKRTEYGFGLRVALNSVNPANIRMVDTRQLDTTTKQKRVFLSKDGPLSEFGFDADADLLGLISGKPADPLLARKLVGADSLHLAGEVPFAQLGNKCVALLKEFNKETYKEKFPFIDYLKVVTDEEILETLNSQLIESIAKKDPRLILAYPEMYDPVTTEKFKISFGKSTREVFDVDTDSVYDFLAGFDIPNDLGEIKIVGLDEDDHPTTKQFDLFDFCVLEVVFNDSHYLLTLRQWFEVAASYLEEINTGIQRIEELPVGYLPDMVSREREDAYNTYVSKQLGYALLDKKNYPAGGVDKIEVCDILTPDSVFICVKKYNGSSTLSHLFAQGSVSSSLLQGEPVYRKFILEKVPTFAAKLPFTEDAIQRTRITFVYAIAVNGEGALVSMLPLFSKINLRNHFKQISDRDFPVKLLRIPIVSKRAA